MLQINILTRYNFPLFLQHISVVDFEKRAVFIENGGDDRVWDLVLVFDGVTSQRSLKIREGGLIFVAGEPPDATNYTSEFFTQFDAIYCAHVNARKHKNNYPDQYFNNWHFGYNSTSHQFRWLFEDLSSMALPAKTREMSVIMSNLAYMPNHLKRRRFLEKLKARFGDRIDVFGKGHRFIPFKDDALLPYRYHICIENCVVPDLWTEKLADPFLGWSVPIYGGCPNVDKYFPLDAVVRIDMDDTEGALNTVGRLLDEGQDGYFRRLNAITEARRRILMNHNIANLAFCAAEAVSEGAVHRKLVKPNENTLNYAIGNALLRIRRFTYRRYFLMAQNVSNAISSK